VSWAAYLFHHLAHAVLLHVRASADGGLVVLMLGTFICNLQKMHGTENLKKKHFYCLYRVRQKNLMIFKLKSNENYTIYVNLLLKLVLSQSILITIFTS
jgi:hypothetical protein